MQTDPGFDALCDEYAAVSKRLEELTQRELTQRELTQREGAEPTISTTALQKRRAAIEEELLAVIEGYRPV
jgi:hypothetical protein